ncbi:MAG TPA: hypothetical protein VME41_16000 [Stellaceae bacterium]|nr:hypothetical protein [Stellaceae bacterium]
MTGSRSWLAFNAGGLTVLALGIAGCIVGGWFYGSQVFFRAWLCTYLFWLGVPLAGVALVLVHDLTGGQWMASTRPVLDAAIATMPLATLSGIAAFVGLHALYGWTHPASSLTNTWYLNPIAFYARYAAYVMLWNGLAAFALWAPRGMRSPIAPGLSWVSGLGLVALALSSGFASIDWMLSLTPGFWSSIFPMIAAASWFNTGFALVLLTVALAGWPAADRRDHMADLARILLATTLLWAYVEFSQFLIIWEENLKTEIPWYLDRLAPAWHGALYAAAAGGFFLPFFILIWTPGKYDRRVVVAVCVFVLLSRIADKWWLVLAQYRTAGPFWLDVAALLALGGLVILPFGWALRYVDRLVPGTEPLWKSGHG